MERIFIINTKKWVKVYTRHLRLLLMRFCKHCQFGENLYQKFLTSFQNLETFQNLPDYKKIPRNLG